MCESSVPVQFRSVEDLYCCISSKDLFIIIFLFFKLTAATCDFLTIVKELLQSGADSSIADSDGCRPVDVADSPAVKELLSTRNQEF